MIVVIPLLVLGAIGYGLYRFARHSGTSRAPTYTFAKGDRDVAVAKRFSTTVAAIQRANGNTTLRMIAPDGSLTSIYLPPGVSDTGAQDGARGKAVL